MYKQQIKIKFDQPLYYINESNGYVKCSLKGVMSIPKDLAVSLGLPEKLKVTSKTEAECVNGDIFDETKGRKITVAKAERNIYRNAAKRLVKRWNKVNDTTGYVLGLITQAIKGTKTERIIKTVIDEKPTLNSVINAFVAKAKRCEEHNERYINEITLSR